MKTSKSFSYAMTQGCGWVAYLVSSKVTSVGGYGGVGIILEWLLGHFKIRVIVIIWIYLQHEGLELQGKDNA